MESLTPLIPALHGDHHVASIRRLLETRPGVSEISLSPATHAATFQFDSARRVLDIPAGHLGDTLAFTHEKPAWEGRPLWPCPGFDRTPIPEN